MNDEKPTHFPAEYITWKHQSRRDIYTLVFEIDAGAFELMRSIIGDPPKNGESKWVAIAPLKNPSAP